MQPRKQSRPHRLLRGRGLVHVAPDIGILLLVTAILAARGVFRAAHHAALEMCAIYWYFVCALWLVLFPLVYLYRS